MKFTAYVQTNANGSRCETEFEVDDEELYGMTDDEREAYLHEQAVEAVFGESLVQIWYEEPEQ